MTGDQYKKFLGLLEFSLGTEALSGFQNYHLLRDYRESFRSGVVISRGCGDLSAAGDIGQYLRVDSSAILSSLGIRNSAVEDFCEQSSRSLLLHDPMCDENGATLSGALKFIREYLHAFSKFLGAVMGNMADIIDCLGEGEKEVLTKHLAGWGLRGEYGTYGTVRHSLTIDERTLVCKFSDGCQEPVSVGLVVEEAPSILDSEILILRGAVCPNEQLPQHQYISFSERFINEWKERYVILKSHREEFISNDAEVTNFITDYLFYTRKYLITNLGYLSRLRTVVCSGDRQLGSLIDRLADLDDEE